MRVCVIVPTTEGPAPILRLSPLAHAPRSVMRTQDDYRPLPPSGRYHAFVQTGGALANRLPWLEPVMRWGGAAFLLIYGARAFWAAWKGGENLQAAQSGRASLGGVLVTCLLLTWANPHVYLDTVVLLGSVAAQYPDRLHFALGAITASFAFFFSLGYGARRLAPLFERPVAWRVLDAFVGCIMWSVALSLLV